MNQNRLGWLFLGFAGCFGLLFILMAGEGNGLVNSHIDGTMQLNFLGIKIAENISTTETWNQFGTYFYLWSILPFVLTIVCFLKFLKLVPTKNKSFA